MHVLWPMKYCTKACSNLFLLTYKILQGIKISSDHKNNIVVESAIGDIDLDWQIKTHDSWVAKVELLRETKFGEAHIVK